MSATADLQTLRGSEEEWYIREIRATPDQIRTELLFEEELELLRKKKTEKISRILSSFFGASIVVILIILLYNYFLQ